MKRRRRTVEVGHWVSGRLARRVNTVADDMLVEFALARLDERHRAAVGEPPEGSAEGGAEESANAWSIVNGVDGWAVHKQEE